MEKNLENINDFEWLQLHRRYQLLARNREIEPGHEKECQSCGEIFLYTQSRIPIDRISGGWLTAYCTQCASDYTGWGAERRFMNADISLDDRWLLTPKGSAASAADPETLAIID